MNILLVEDDSDVRKMTTRLLEYLNCSVVAVSDGSDALSSLTNKGNSFDLVMTDYSMPDMNGVELAANLKRILPDIPVILCTGAGGSDNDSLLSESGITEVLTKPYSRNDLYLTIKRAMER
ncbi:MAG: response regulator [Desulfatiglans sp.]|nr:response regulator [Desulfatiglans sp.]